MMRRKSKIIAGLKDAVRYSRDEKVPGVKATRVYLMKPHSKWDYITTKEEMKTYIEEIDAARNKRADLGGQEALFELCGNRGATYKRLSRPGVTVFVPGKQFLEMYDAIRLSLIALHSASTVVEELGDKKAAQVYDKRAYENSYVIRCEPPFARKKRLARAKK